MDVHICWVMQSESEHHKFIINYRKAVIKITGQVRPDRICANVEKLLLHSSLLNVA